MSLAAPTVVLLDLSLPMFATGPGPDGDTGDLLGLRGLLPKLLTSVTRGHHGAPALVTLGAANTRTRHTPVTTGAQEDAITALR